MVQPSKHEPRIRERVRIRFSKQGELRLIGHRDLARLVERLFRRAGLPLGMSEGFHPKPRISFPSALAVGIEGLDEVMEVELARCFTADELLTRLAPASISGLTFRSVEVLPPGTRKARLKSLTYQVPIPVDHRDRLPVRVGRLMAGRCCPITRTNDRKTVDPRESLEELTLSEGVLLVRFRATERASAGVRDVLRSLDLEDLEQEGVCLTRTAVELRP